MIVENVRIKNARVRLYHFCRLVLCVVSTWSIGLALFAGLDVV